MRWLLRRAPDRPSTGEPLDRIDPTTLEVVEIGDDGLLRGPAPERRAQRILEVGYAPRERDPTSLAGIWEALAVY
jgi:hypothetical protein